jgi:hypothetical protein
MKWYERGGTSGRYNVGSNSCIISSCREPDMATNYVREEIKEINDQTR